MKIFYTILISLAVSVGQLYGNNSTTKYIGQLINGSKTEQASAIEAMITKSDPACFEILQAANSKKLYIYNNQLATTAHTENGQEVFFVYPEYRTATLNGKAVIADDADLKEIKISRTLRLKITPLLPMINLNSKEEERRVLAYTQIQADPRLELLGLVETASEKESTEQVRRLATETALAIQLQVENDEIRKKTIQELVANKGDNTLGILLNLEKKLLPESPLNAQLAQAIDDTESRISRLEVAQNLFSGLSLSSILIMVALGLAIIYGLAGVINMAHGEFLMIGAYTTYCLQGMFGALFPGNSELFFWVSLPASFLVAGLFGLLIERLIIRHLYNRPLETLLATWGVSLILIQLARTVFGDLTAVKTPESLMGGWEVVPGLMLPFNRIFIIGLTLAMLSITYFIFYKSKMGLKIRSVTQNRSMSACLGISTKRIDTMTFFMGSGLAGIAGCAMTLIGNVVPNMGQTYIVDSFLVVVTGGVGKLVGTIISGLGIGFMSKFLEPIFQAVYGKVLILAIIIFFLQFRSKGLFPDKGRVADE